MSSVLSRLKLSQPAGWRDLSVLTFVEPEAKTFAANVVVTHAPLDGAGLEAHVEAEALAFENELNAFKRVRVERLPVAGKTGYAVEQTFKTDSGLLLRQLALYVDDADTVFTLTVTHSDDAFEALRPRFYELVQSLSFVPA